jgi:hypothetical protein
VFGRGANHKISAAGGRSSDGEMDRRVRNIQVELVDSVGNFLHRHGGELWVGMVLLWVVLGAGIKD